VPDPDGGGAPPPADRPRDAATIVVGVLVILGGVALAFPAGFCSAVMVPTMGEASGTSDIAGAIGILVVALAVTAAGAFCIWLGCRMVLAGRAVGWGFGIIVAVTIFLIIQLAVSLFSMHGPM
jgi:hypothetical protein